MELIKVGKNKNKLVIVYSDIVKEYIDLFYYGENKLINKKTLDLHTYKYKNGETTFVNEVTKVIKTNFPNASELYLVLNSKDVFKNVITIPKSSKFTSLKMYLKEFKLDYPDIKNKYKVYKTVHQFYLGNIYSAYFIPTNLIDSFKKVASFLKLKLRKIDLLANYLLINNNEINHKNVVHLYYENDNGVLILERNNFILTFTSFKFKTLEDLNANFMTIISKHELELEKLKLDEIIIYGEEDYFEKLNYGIPIIHKVRSNNEIFTFNGFKLK